MQKNTLFLVIGVLIVVLVAVLFTLFPGDRSLERDNDGSPTSWKEIPLRDVSTSGVFRVRDLEGKPVLLFFLLPGARYVQPSRMR
jgi:hypothetical protein